MNSTKFIREDLSPKQEAEVVVRLLEELLSQTPGLSESVVPDNFGREYRIFLTAGQYRAITNMLARVTRQCSTAK